MKRNVIETVLGAVVLAIAGLFLAFSYSSASMGSTDGYEAVSYTHLTLPTTPYV